MDFEEDKLKIFLKVVRENLSFIRPLKRFLIEHEINEPFSPLLRAAWKLQVYLFYISFYCFKLEFICYHKLSNIEYREIEAKKKKQIKKHTIKQNFGLNSLY